MSFLKKLKDELKDFLDKDDDKDKSKKEGEAHKTQDPGHGQGHSQQYAQSYAQGPPHHDQQQPYPQYGGPPHHDQQQPYPQYGGPPPQQSGYGQTPQLPPGWIAQWDQNSQQWYYVEQATGRRQWEQPNGQPVQGGGPLSSFQNMVGHNDHSKNYMAGEQKKDKKGGMGGMLAAGIGGAGLGALAGHALSDNSDDEHHGGPASYNAAPAPGGYGYGAPPAAGQSGEPPLEYNQELSSSQRSSLHEAREDVEEARAEVANDSDPSSSDVEELQEAQEEYASEVESAHSELEDE